MAASPTTPDFNTDKCLLTVDMSAPTISFNSHTHLSPLDDSSTMKSRDGCAKA